MEELILNLVEQIKELTVSAALLEQKLEATKSALVNTTAELTQAKEDIEEWKKKHAEMTEKYEGRGNTISYLYKESEKQKERIKELLAEKEGTEEETDAV